MSKDQAGEVVVLLRTIAFALGIITAILLVDTASASITAVSSTRDNQTQLDVTAKLDITAKRPLKRKVFAMACTPDDLCRDHARPGDRPIVRLVKGRNRLSVTFTVTAWQDCHVLDPARPFESVNDGFCPAVADRALVWFGQSRSAVMARPVGASASRERLVQP